MPNIRPVSDLRNKFAEISKEVHETNEPVFLTKNGKGNMVVMSMDAYEDKIYDDYVERKLMEAAAIEPSGNKPVKDLLDELDRWLKAGAPEDADVRD